MAAMAATCPIPWRASNKADEGLSETSFGRTFGLNPPARKRST